MSSRHIQVGVAVVAALAVVTLFFIFNPFNTVQPDTTPSTASDQLVVQDEVVGTGAVAQVGDVLTVNYTGKFANGTVFDTSVGKRPFQFTLGGQVIAGWNQGMVGMKVGGKRILIVAPSLGYGPKEYGPIPGNSTLTFEVELLGVSSSTPSATQ